MLVESLLEFCHLPDRLNGTCLFSAVVVRYNILQHCVLKCFTYFTFGVGHCRYIIQFSSVKFLIISVLTKQPKE